MIDWIVQVLHIKYFKFFRQGQDIHEFDTKINNIITLKGLVYSQYYVQ